MRLDHLSVKISRQLLQAGIIEHDLEAQLLICKALNITKENYYAQLQKHIQQDRINNINLLVTRRINKEPLSYICSYREFYGLDLYVDCRVLIPRQETEIIVDKAIKFLKSKVSSNQQIKILDLGTGSGALAIALAKFLPESIIYATDISNDALQVAEINCSYHNVGKVVNLICLDGLTGFVGGVDLVVANPPYLSRKEMAEVQPELLFEPNIALYGGLAGWEKSVELIESTGQIMNDGGKAFFETSPECIDSITREISKKQNVKKLETHVDYSGNNRVIELSF
tara:strand:+ start:605 stop:1456 length:852 start_codon:yes stop_codon:yes gene_type:complete